MENENTALPTIKVFNIDYSFIIKNYLNPELWQKTWTLFEYKGFVFGLKIDRINCQDEKVSFIVFLEDRLNPEDYYSQWNSYPNRVSTYIDYSLKINDVNFLKRKINSSMTTLVEYLEVNKCKATEEYKTIEDSKEQEESILREIAENFLNDNNVSNEDIREVYIENYIENNLQIDTKLEQLKDYSKYNLLTELYVILAQLNNDEYLSYRIEKAIKDKQYFIELKQETEEYLESLETEEMQEELKDNLEEI